VAKPRKNLIIKESKTTPNLLEVWTPAPAKAKGLIEAIEGIARVYHFEVNGYLNVWLNPCYSKAEIKAEIRVALSEQQQLDHARAHRERFRGDWHRVFPRWPEKTIAKMRVGESATPFLGLLTDGQAPTRWVV